MASTVANSLIIAWLIDKRDAHKRGAGNRPFFMLQYHHANSSISSSPTL